MATNEYESNPYLILYSPKLKSTMKPADAVGLLDPPQDEAKIGARLAEVERLKDDGVAVTDYERRHYNGKLAEVKAALLDGGSGERKKHIDAARKEIERRFLQELQSYIFGGGRDLLKANLDRVAGKFKRWLKPATAEAVAKSAGYQVVDKIGPTETPLPVPPKPKDWPDKNARDAGVIDKKISEYLSFLGTHEGRAIRNVYEFLNASRTSPLATLQKGLSDAKTQYNTRNASQVNKTPHLQAASSLFLVLDKMLQTDETRRHWERCWALVQIDEELRPVFSTLVIGGKVGADAYLGAVQKCREKGLSAEDAAYYAYEYFVTDKKCPMPARVSTDATPREEVRFCGVCHAANAKSAKVCKGCGSPLEVKCPKCGSMVSLDSTFCSHQGCGFPIGNMPVALTRLKDAELKYARGDFGGAKVAVAEALAFWPGNADCLALQEKISRGLARIHLENIVLSPPMTATVGSTGTVRLGWSAASLKNAALGTERAKISCLVIRKEGGTPSSPTDGDRMVETLSLQFEDTKATPGVIYGYGVFPCYGGVPKIGGVVSPKVVTVCDVSGLKSSSDSGLIRLQWKNPPNAAGVVCVRKQGGIPTSLKDGVRVPVKAEDTGVVDSGLTNRTRYGYRVLAVFKGAAGESICSSGVTCEATPAERPPQVDNLAYEMDGSSCARLTWQPLTSGRGIVKIYVSSAPLPVAGTFVSETDGAFAACSEVRSCNQVVGKAELRPIPTGIVYLTPVTCKDGVAVIGKGVPLLPCVTNLKMIRRNGDLEISWDWPKGCSEVRLLLRTDSMPTSPTDSSARAVTMMQSAYSRDKAYIVRHAGDGTYYCAVYVVAKVNGTPVYSAPQTCVSVGNVERGRISYAFRKKKQFGLFGKADVTLEITSSNGIMPALMLVKKFGAQPLSRNDGVTSLKIPAAMAASCAQLLAASVAEPGAFLKLFLENKSDESSFTINHPSFSEMKI